MPKLDTKPYKGVRDFYPEDQFIQNYIFSVWRKTVESFGYEEYSASILEPTEIYTEKSGAEIINEQTYTFTDRGGREVTLRPEMTPTIARMIAARKRELAFPLRWYSIPNLFRYEATQRGRLREHWQLNVDLFGVDELEADLEIIKVSYEILKAFGADDDDFEIRLNNPQGKQKDLKDFMTRLSDIGIFNTSIDTTLTRGQAYYTGIVFEVFDTDPENPRSILGGGRYDNLTSLYLPENKTAMNSDLPAVGFGAGDVTIRDFLETHNLLPKYKPNTDLYMAVIENKYFTNAEKLAEDLREKGVNIAVDWSGRKVGDQLKTADKLKIPFVIVLGEDEVKSHTYKLKNLDTGEEKSVTTEELVQCVK